MNFILKMSESGGAYDEKQNDAGIAAPRPEGPRLPTPAAVGGGWSFTIEHALYAAAFAIAAAIRFWGLSRMPLNSLEALNSWRAWQDAMGMPGPTVLVPTSPLFLHAQTLIFWLGANGDAAARVVGAAAGALLVLVPWWLRGLLGRSTALVLSFLFAVDPWLVAFSRFADGAMLSTLLAMALLALLLMSAREGREPGAGSREPFGRGAEGRGPEGLTAKRRRTVTAMIAVLGGLFLTSGHMAWSYLPVLIAFTVFNYETLKRVWLLDRIAVGWFVGAFLVGATGWLIRPGDIGMVSASLTMWANAALSTGMPTLALQANGGYPLSWSISTLLADQPLITLFGLGGLIHMSLKRRTAVYSALHWRAVLWIWLVWGAILLLLPGRSPFSLLVLVMPLLFGTAYSAGALIGGPEGSPLVAALIESPLGAKSRETIAVVGTLLLLLVSAALWGAALVSAQTLDILMLQALLLILLMSTSILVFYGVWTGWKEAVSAGIVAIGVALFFVNLGAAWRINQRYDLGRPGGLFAESGNVDIRRLAEDIETISAQRVGDPFEIPVIVDKYAMTLPDNAAPVVSRPEGSGAQRGALWAPGEDRDALLGWYLRNMRRLQWGTDGRADVVAVEKPLVISRDDAGAGQTFAGGADYIGSRYGIRSIQAFADNPAQSSVTVDGAALSSGQRVRSLLEREWSRRMQPWLRWSFYREENTPPAVEKVILWAPRPE